jgi:hypothetical protein
MNELDKPTQTEMNLIRHNLLNPKSRIRRYWHIQALRCQHRINIYNQQSNNRLIGVQ